VRDKRRVSEPLPIHEVLPALLRGVKQAAGGPMGRVRNAWAEVVGPAIAARTRVAALENGRVRVEVASAALKHDLGTFRQAEVLRGLQERLPDMEIRGVSYRVSALS
jgi:predicted nucleic acid-binding Zn ribbon protein